MTAPVRLHGERADAYLAVLRGLLAVARPGAHYPDARRVDAHLSFLGPSGSRGLVDGLDIDPASGLPTLRELLRVRADRDIADGFLREHGDRLPHKAGYYRALAAAEVAPAAALDVKLRGRRGRTARFQVVHDRIDAVSGTFVRFTAQLTEEGERHVALARGDLSAPTERFRAVVERYSGADAELALLLLADLPGVRVSEVVRGEIGPLSLAGLPAPPLLEEVLAAAPGAFVLHLAFERAGTGVAADRVRDPFGRAHRDGLAAEARAALDARRAGLGYRVARERRLMCTAAAEPLLRAALAAAGTPLVVRSR